MKSLLAAFLLLCFWSCTSKKEVLMIASAANSQEVLKELVKEFEARYHIDCQVITGSSGKLAAQLMEKAPYHIFFSADTLNPWKLYQKQLTDGAPVLYAKGSLVLWVRKGLNVSTMDDLNLPEVKYVAIANPQLAPYGSAAIEVLNQINGFNQSKLVYGESVGQVNQFIQNNAVDAAITSWSYKNYKGLGEGGKWIEIENGLYSEIDQSVVVIKTTKEIQRKARLFLKFVDSDRGKDILNKFGYQTIHE